MSDLVPRRDQGLDHWHPTRQDRRQLAEVRLQAQLAKFWEYAEAERAESQVHSGKRLTERAGVELVALHHSFTVLAAGDPAVEFMLRGLEDVYGRGCSYVVHNYMTRR